jgi:hypothetical protein
MMLSGDLELAIARVRARVRFAFPWWLRPFLARDVIGITLGSRIYVAAGRASAGIERLLRHELVHVDQVRRLGLIRFYWCYAAEYFSLRRSGLDAAAAYRSLSFEREAVAAESGTEPDV